MLAHYCVWEAGVLQRDVSDNNAMFRRNKDGTVVGVLCDFDLARLTSSIERAEFQAKEKKPRTNEETIVGTRRFMSCELQNTKNAPIQTYRHDLESFLWLLMYHCGTHDPEQNVYRAVDAWELDSVKIIADNKIDFLIINEDDPSWAVPLQDSKDMYLGEGHLAYKGLVEEWIMPLRRLFVGHGITRIIEECQKGWDVDGPSEEDLAIFQVWLERQENENENENFGDLKERFFEILGIDNA